MLIRGEARKPKDVLFKDGRRNLSNNLMGETTAYYGPVRLIPLRGLKGILTCWGI
jgi:hypothetical protein